MRRFFLVFFLGCVALAWAEPSTPDWALGGWYVPDDPDIAIMVRKASSKILVAVQYHEWSCGGLYGSLAGSAIEALLMTEGMEKTKTVVWAILKKEDLPEEKQMTIRIDGKNVIFVQTK